MRPPVGTQEVVLCPLPGPLGFFLHSPNFEKNMQDKHRHTYTQTQAEKWDHSVLKLQCVCMYVSVYACVCLHEAINLFIWSLNISSPTLLRELSAFTSFNFSAVLNTPGLPSPQRLLCAPKISQISSYQRVVKLIAKLILQTLHHFSDPTSVS